MATRKGPIKVLHYGLGPIGAAVVKQVADRRGFKIVGAVDIDPAKVGRDLGQVAGVGRALRVKVSNDAKKTIKATKPDVVVLCTLSSLKKVLPQMEEILKLKVPIVSTTEELAYPTGANMKYARAIHEMAKKAKVAVLGTGVNPGFTMDALPITLTGVCERVDSIRVDRIQDARVRRLPFQQKIGAGLTREQFQKKVDDASVRHVGLAESVSMIADAMGWKLDKITDEIQPKMATAHGGERVPGGGRGLRVRPRAGRHRLPQRPAGDHAAHGGVSRRAGVVRRGGDCRVAEHQEQDRGRRPRRRGHGVDHRQLDPEDPRGRARPAHHARHADSVVLRRLTPKRQAGWRSRAIDTANRIDTNGCAAGVVSRGARRAS